ncbi:MAG: response regulator [Sporichthyaceae bacterium]
MDGVRNDLDAVDWASTPLGCPKTWPQSLRTTVDIMLGSRFAMWMAWGPDLSFFCNDAYRRDTLGKKYPWALGRPAREVWAEIWDEIGPRIDRVLATGVATWDEGLLLYLERAGYPEETYHTFSYSPLADDQGNTAGMLCVVSEDTDRVIGARRMATLRDLAAATASALTVEECFAQACDELGRNRRDIPFSLFYARPDAALAAVDDLRWEQAAKAELACAVGLDADHPAVFETVAIDDARARWPLSGTEALVDLGDFPALPAGELPESPADALVLPLRTAPHRTPYGWLIIGLNRFRPLDEDYRAFIDLVVGEINAAITAAGVVEGARRRAAELAELDAAKTRFFTNISHELRTPLTLILGPTADLLADRAQPLAERQRKRAEMALRNGERLLGLVNTLLDFSRIQAGRAHCRRQSTDLAQYTAELAAMFESVTTSAGLTLTVATTPLSTQASVDREMWTKIVLNLLSNALKFTFEGGITVELRELGDPPAQDGDGARPWVELVVRDTGIGIAPEDQQHLFERFHRVAGARSRTHEGSGIGLALVAELAALHGGVVEMASTPGVGSSFFVRIPATAAGAASEAEPDGSADGHDGESGVRTAQHFVEEAARWVSDTQAAVANQAPPPSDGAVEPGRERILVVDDNADMRTFLVSLLGDHYEVDIAVDGVQALARARTELPDVVLTDVMMPNLDGFGLLREMAADPALRDVPVIMVSARAGEEGVSRGLEAGATDYVLKPFSARELLARVRATLELDRARRESARTAPQTELLERGQQCARIGFWSVDIATGATSASSGLISMMGMPAEEITALGFEQAVQATVHPEDQHLVFDAVEAGMRGEPVVYTIRLVPPGGGDVRVCEVLAEVEFVDGAPSVIRGFTQDVTHRARA